MKTDELRLTTEPNPTQIGIANQHKDLCDEFLYDADGLGVYAVCSDGLVKIDFKPETLVDCTPNIRFLEMMRNGLC